MKRLLFLMALIASLSGAKTDTTSFVLALNNTVFMGAEDVNFTGTVHVVTKLAPVDPCAPTDPCKLTVHVNAMNLVGVGVDSGGTYRVVGNANDVATDLTALPTGGLIEVPGFKVVTPLPPPIVPPNPTRVELDLAIDAAGNVSVTAANLALDVT